MGLMESMIPGGDSKITDALRIRRDLIALVTRTIRARTKGMTTAPVVGRGLIIQNDAGQLYLDLTDVVLRDLMGLFGASGKAFLSADRFGNELDPDDSDSAPYAVDKPGIVLYKGRLIFIGSEADIGEQMQSHCILNGSFEVLGVDGSPEFWSAKP